MEERKNDGYILGALIGGVVSAIVCIILWVLITNWLEFEHSYYALVAGAIIGFSVRWTGRGDNALFGVIASICAIAACVISELICNNILYGLFDDPIDYIYSILFYGVAAVEAFKIGTNENDG